MCNKIGNFFIILGTALMLGALSLFLWNHQEAAEAESASAEVMPALVKEILTARDAEPEIPAITPDMPEELLSRDDMVMSESIINGHAYIGYLYLPDLGLELPVMSDWSYEQLRLSPCRYSGTVRGNDLVLLAHNYGRHFGMISSLSEGSEVTFTDMDGTVWKYRVVAKDVLEADAVEEMVCGEYDLTLFTCNTAGTHRITIRCDKTGS